MGADDHELGIERRDGELDHRVAAKPGYGDGDAGDERSRIVGFGIHQSERALFDLGEHLRSDGSPLVIEHLHESDGAAGCGSAGHSPTDRCPARR